MHRIIGFLLVLLLMFGHAAAQEEPVVTPTPTLAAVIPPTATATPQPPPPPPTALPAPSADMAPLDATLLAARNDLELLANATTGAAERPEGWSGTFDVTDPQMALLLRLDLENLAGTVAEGRPTGWFGVVPSTAQAVARDVRHDLELLADAVVGLNVRPPNWMGDDLLMRCGRATQSLAALLQENGLYVPVTTPGTPNYCGELETELSLFVENNLLGGVANPAVLEPTPTVTVDPNAVSIISDTALAYRDRGATDVAGTIPQGTRAQAVARSYAQFSRMVLLRGEGFELFVDYENTTLDQLGFEALIDVSTQSVTPSCTADWCG